MTTITNIKINKSSKQNVAQETEEEDRDKDKSINQPIYNSNDKNERRNQ